MWAAVEQCERRRDDGCTPVVVLKRNHTPAHVLLPLEEFVRLISAKPCAVDGARMRALLEQLRDCLPVE